ncbi:putative F-box domain-containing protein [Rosa chinensis]|uniref:Putative F-box domain-containing protein n=1 Tax=Rosa chinensis TaxID=74649 RepID=A0A2P6SMV0_ROSCH|nr:putative F-box domain-containing protein [Rosa chinensis]
MFFLFVLADWSELPNQILESVLERLDLLADYVRFSVVCRSWNFIAKDNRKKRVKMPCCHPPPMLLINTDIGDIWKVYNVTDDKLLDLQVRVPNTRFCGSSKGWLIFVENDFTVTLINPFFRVRGRVEKENSIIHLPPLRLIKEIDMSRVRHERYVYKATISADPVLNANECIVVVITQPGYQLAFIRLGKDRAWSYIDGRARGRGFDEVIFLGGKFYGVRNNGRLLSLEITRFSFNRKLAARSLRRDHTIKSYLVYSNKKELLMVERHISFDRKNDMRTTSKFIIYKLNFDECKWTKKNSLGGETLFLGDNSSFSVISSSFPGCLRNCIYFTHDYDWFRSKFGPRGPNDFGVYDVEDESFLSIDSTKASMLVKMSLQPSIWILPTFQL